MRPERVDSGRARFRPHVPPGRNAIFDDTLLYGGNAAYIEELYARYQADPATVDAEWRALFQSLKDEKIGRRQKRAWRVLEDPQLARAAERRSVAALDGQWAETKRKSARRSLPTPQAKGVELSSADVLQATRNSIHALMLIRAYRVRGHLLAKLDPLALEPEKNRRRTRSAYLRFTDADLDRRI